MKKHFVKFLKKEEGQSAVLFALSVVVLMGAAACGTDLGRLHLAKTRMQNAADLAAYTAACYLPANTQNFAQTAIDAATDTAESNGAPRDGVTVNLNYDGDPALAEVICRETVKYTFAKVIGFDETEVEGRAVARKESYWIGEALPFLNMEGHYWEPGEVFEIWDKSDSGHNPGHFERIADIEDDPKAYWQENSSPYCPKRFFTVDYRDGVMIANGKKAYIKQFVQYVYDTNSTAYVFSLTKEAMESGRYDRTKNKQLIPESDLVLLQVNLLNYTAKGNKSMILTVSVNEVYDISSGDYPTTFLRGGSTASLVE